MIIAVVAVLATQYPGHASTGSAALRSYQRANALLDAGVEALGGSAALAGLRTVYRSIQGGWVGNGQRPSPVTDTLPTLDVQPYVFNDRLTSHIDYAGTRWIEHLFEAAAISPGDRIEQTEVVSREVGFQSSKYYRERPLLRHYPAADLPGLATTKLRRYPEGLLRMALQRKESLQWVEPNVISFVDDAGVRVLLYFDAESRLLTRSETLTDHAVAGDSYRDIVYLDYRLVGPLRLPGRIVTRAAGIPVEEYVVDSTALNVPLPETAFRPPPDGIPVEPDPDALTLEHLGDGLYLLRGPYNSVVAEFTDHLVLFEAPLGSAHGEALLRVVRDAFPAKPVRYLISSHFHYDHVAGIRPFVARGTTIVTTGDAVPVIRRAVASRRTIRPDTLSALPVAPRLEVVKDRRVLEDASNRVELYDVGPMPHAAQILVAYFPKERTLAVADLVDVSSLELVLVGPDADPLWEKLRRLGLRVERIIPVHGIPANADHLERAMALRAKYVGP